MDGELWTPDVPVGNEAIEIMCRPREVVPAAKLFVVAGYLTVSVEVVQVEHSATLVGFSPQSDLVQSGLVETSYGEVGLGEFDADANVGIQVLVVIGVIMIEVSVVQLVVSLQTQV